MTAPPPPLILTIDDEPAITDSLSYALTASGYRALAAPTLAAASALLEERGAEVSLVVLDLALPDGHGFDWLRRLRARSQVPVLILSSHDDEVEHIVGLELGADDYINKPFSPREVVARVRAVLRRAAPPEPAAPAPAPAPA
ncbi:MAG: response regulator, partial [Deltaproteobacteria bacterium]|nr:response regulator [Deltaproteobacteria bacterium]